MDEQARDRHGKLPDDYNFVPWTSAVQYLTEKGVSPICNSCGHHGGAVNTQTDGIHTCCYADNTIFQAKDGSIWSGGQQNLFFVAQCNNCGSMRQFDFGPLLAWYETKQKEQTA